MQIQMFIGVIHGFDNQYLVSQNQQRKTLVLAGIHNGLVRNSLLCIDLDSKTIMADRLINFPIGKGSCDSVWIYCSCNGLLCLSIEAETQAEFVFIYIYNCCTTEVKRIIPKDYEAFQQNKYNSTWLWLCSVNWWLQAFGNFSILQREYSRYAWLFLKDYTWKIFETKFRYF